MVCGGMAQDEVEGRASERGNFLESRSDVEVEGYVGGEQIKSQCLPVVAGRPHPGDDSFGLLNNHDLHSTMVMQRLERNRVNRFLSCIRLIKLTNIPQLSDFPYVFRLSDLRSFYKPIHIHPLSSFQLLFWGFETCADIIISSSD